MIVCVYFVLGVLCNLSGIDGVVCFGGVYVGYGVNFVVGGGVGYVVCGVVIGIGLGVGEECLCVL